MSVDLFGNETLRPVIWRDKEVPGYQFNIKGELWSDKTNKFLKPQYEVARFASGEVRKTSVKYNLTIPTGYFEDYNYTTYGLEDTSWEVMTIRAHRAMMNTFRPIDEYPPEELADTWNAVITPDMVGKPLIPQAWKQFVKDTVVVDHWDDNPLNNSIDNLRWCTSIENSHHRKKRKYGIIEEDKNSSPLEDLLK
jgi:hypothetical protein